MIDTQPWELIQQVRCRERQYGIIHKQVTNNASCLSALIKLLYCKVYFGRVARIVNNSAN